MLHPQTQLSEELEKDSALPFLDIMVKRTGELAEIDIYHKPMHSFRYAHYDAAQLHYMKKETVRGLVLRAQRILHKFPLACKREIKLLKRTFTDDKNGYPPFVMDRSVKQFDWDLMRKPALAYVPTWLKIDSMLDAQGDQLFRQPTAANRLVREHHVMPADDHVPVVSTEQAHLGTVRMDREHIRRRYC